MEVRAEHGRYQEFYKKSLPILIRCLRRWGVTTKEDIEDLVQETYIEVYKAWATLVNEESRVSWMIIIGRRKFGRYLQKRHRTLPLTVSDADSNSIEQIENTPEVGPEQSLDNDRLCQRIVKRISGVTNTTKRDTLIRYYLREESLAEISETTGVNRSTVTTWLARFREDLGQDFAGANQKLSHFGISLRQKHFSNKIGGKR